MTHQNPYREDDAAQRRADVLGAWMSAAPAPAVVQAGTGSATSQELVMKEREDRARKYRPTVPKKIAAWLSAGLGIFFLIGVAMPPADGTTFPQHAAMGLCMAVSFGLPGAYWLMCNRRDQKKVAQWVRSDASYRDQLSLMSDADRSLLAKPDEWPSIPKRHWPIVWTLVLLAFIAFAIVAPDAATTV